MSEHFDEVAGGYTQPQPQVQNPTQPQTPPQDPYAPFEDVYVYVPAQMEGPGFQQLAPSYFDGGLLQLIGYRFLGVLVTVCTLGICFPWAFTMIYSWEAKHTVINGYRLEFDGTALQLFGNWIKWLLLTIITFGIYGFWVEIKLRKWKISHTNFARVG